MKNQSRFFYLKFVFAVFWVALAAQIAVAVADPSFQSHINQLAPVFGVGLALVLIGGFRFLPAVCLGALIPAYFSESDVLVVLSMPVAMTCSVAIGVVVLRFQQIEVRMERIRDAFHLIFLGIIVCTAIGAFMQATLLCGGASGIGWDELGDLFLTNWLAASVGAIILTPFVLTWSQPSDYDLGVRQLLEVLVWFSALIFFGAMTFMNWAPTDVFFYPMELAIFPIMAWGAIRFGLRGASAGVLVLALVATWALVPVLGEEGRYISQSPANVWVFVGIVSITSICLASIMAEIRIRERQIAENENRLRAFTHALPDVAFVLSEDGVIHDVFSGNFIMESNHRIDCAEAICGRQIDAVFDLKLAQQFQTTMGAALVDDVVTTFEYSIISGESVEHHFEARVSPMADASHRLRQVVWVAYDITSRKKSEDAIRQRDGILNATALANNTLLTTADFDQAVKFAIQEMGNALGVERGYLFEVSKGLGGTREGRTCSARFEWRADDTLPRAWNGPEQVSGLLDDLFPAFYERLVQGRMICCDARGVSAEEDAFFEGLNSRSLLVIPMWVEGVLSGFFAFDYYNKVHAWNRSEINAVRVLASGISGLVLIRAREDQLRVARDLANSASSAKGEFLAIMSHEIRTPMNAIIGYSDLLNQSDLDAGQKEQLAIIKRSGKALLELINNILDYSKIESRSLELESLPFHLEQVVCEALENVLPRAKEQGLILDFEIASDVGKTYIGDAHRLRQVLMNLANNAVKFTKKGSVVMRVKLSEESESRDGDALHFEVIDTGCGIPAEKFDRLFQAFSQVDSSTTRHFGGTGLGLVISRRLVERMDGRIWAESTLNEGSNFQFVIRLKQPDQFSASRPPFTVPSKNPNEERIDASFAHSHPLKLLLCEDDKENRWVINELLVTLGYQPAIVKDAEEATARLQADWFDAVLLDVRLPGQSGLELAELIRSGSIESVNPAQYLIAVTAFAMNEDRDKCLAVGMNDYLSKPLKVPNLKGALADAHSALYPS